MALILLESLIFHMKMSATHARQKRKQSFEANQLIFRYRRLL